MYEKCRASLRMVQMILQDGAFDENTYPCQAVTYNPDEECIYLLTGETELPTFSLDGVYECTLRSGDEEVICQGLITDRYENRLGRVLVFGVHNGFYKKNVN